MTVTHGTHRGNSKDTGFGLAQWLGLVTVALHLLWLKVII